MVLLLNFSSFATDKRWLSIYTVCMDLLTSPEMQTLVDKRMSLSSPYLSKAKPLYPHDNPVK